MGRETAQIPTRNPFQEVLFKALNIIPQGMQQSLINQPGFGEQVPAPGGGNIQSGSNIFGRALAGMGRDVAPALESPLTSNQIQGNIFKPPIDTRELVAGLTAGQVPQGIPPPALPSVVPQPSAIPGGAIPQKPDLPSPEKEKGFLAKLLSNPEFLKALPTLAAAGIGSAVPGALPGAAGFAGGYEGAREKQRERQTTLDVAQAKEVKAQEKQDLANFKTSLSLVKDVNKDSVTGSIGMTPEKLLEQANDVNFMMHGKRIKLTKEIKDEVARSAGLGNSQLIKPDNVPNESWDAATDQQRAELLKALGQQ